MLIFQPSETDTDENGENLDHDSDFDDLEELLKELIRNKVPLKVYFSSLLYCIPAYYSEFTSGNAVL